MRRTQLLWMIFQVVFIIILLSPPTFAEEKGLARIESKIDALTEKQIDMDKRLTAVEEGQKHLIKRMDDMMNLLYVVLAGMFALVGFVIWDRRTALAPAIRQIKELEDREEKIEKALKEYAKEDPKLAEVLKHIGIY